MIFQNMNQLAQTPIKGAIAGKVSPSVVSCQIIGTSVATLVPGDYVKLVTGTGNTILVDKAGLTDQPFGAVVFNPKKDKFVAYDEIEVCLAFGIMFMESGASITRGDQLQFTPTGSLVITNAGNPVCGLALDPASGANQVLRVLILNALTIPATITSGSIDGTPIGGSTPSTGKFTTLEATGAVTLDSTVTGPGAGSGMYAKRVRTTIANVNAGATLVAAVTGRKLALVNVKVVAVGGAVTSTTATGLAIIGTVSASPVNLLALTKAVLTQSSINTMTGTGTTVPADGGSFVDLDVTTGITIQATGGSDLAGASNIDVVIEYVVH
jgi:hypothetical protein